MSKSRSHASSQNAAKCVHGAIPVTRELEVLMATDVPGILIVDDNEDNRYTLQLLLESDDYARIASAASGNEAIALLEKQKFSLVLLDLMMPDLNGDQVLRLIKSDPE